MTPLEQRLSKLERSLKLYRVLFGSAAILIVAFTLISSGKKPSAPDVIQAKKFELVDDYGNVIGTFHQKDGNGALTTYTSSGIKLVSLFTISGGGGGAINTFDDAGNVLLKITKTTGGGGYLGLYNKNASEIIQMGASTINAGYLQVNDNSGTELAYLTQQEGGGGNFSLYNNDAKSLVLSSDDVGARIGVYNTSGQRVVYAGTQDDGSGDISIYGKVGGLLGSIPR
jgi:hypothetical protein